MKYYLRKKVRYGYIYYGLGYMYYSKSEPTAFDTIEAAKSKGQELGGDFQIVNERFEVVWPVK